MSKKNTVTLFAVIMAVMILIGSFIASDYPLGKMPSVEEKYRIKARFDKYIKDSGFSGAVYAVYHGGVIYDGGAGKAATELENGSDVAYGVASLTKQFTAAAILQLYQEGKLALDDKLSVYFPDYRYGDRITIEQLLCQRSGIPDYMVNTGRNDLVVISCYNGGKAYTTIDSSYSHEENTKRIRDFFFSQELLFEPGSTYDYSDSNFALLAEIIARVSGKSYHEYIRERIFRPLGMTHSAFIDDYENTGITKIAGTDRTEFKLDYYSLPGAEYGCGDILSTPKDLYLWYKGLTSGKVLNKKTYQLMVKNRSSEDELGYGCGVMISDTSDSKAVFHYGYIPSYYSAIHYVPAYDYFQVVLSNHANGDPHVMAADMVKYFGSAIGLKLVDVE